MQFTDLSQATPNMIQAALTERLRGAIEYGNTTIAVHCKLCVPQTVAEAVVDLTRPYGLTFCVHEATEGRVIEII